MRQNSRIGNSASDGRLPATVGYVRVSTLKQASEGVSLDTQAARIAAYCQLAGLQLVELIREEGISASIPLAERPVGQRVIAALRQHKAEHPLVALLRYSRL